MDKETQSARLTGINKAFVRRNVLTFEAREGRSDALEVEFARKVETPLFRHLYRYIDGSDDADAQQAVKGLAALHWARSEPVVRAASRALDEVAQERANTIDQDAEVRELFEDAYGRLPTPDELAEMTLSRAAKLKAANNLFAQTIQRYYNTALEHFSACHLQRCHLAQPNGVELAFADSPVVVTGGIGNIEGSARHPFPLMQASQIWFPLAPLVGVCLTSEPTTSGQLTPAAAQQLNQLSWRYAWQRLGVRLGADIDLAFGRPPGTLTTLG